MSLPGGGGGGDEGQGNGHEYGGMPHSGGYGYGRASGEELTPVNAELLSGVLASAFGLQAGAGQGGGAMAGMGDAAGRYPDAAGGYAGYAAAAENMYGRVPVDGQPANMAGPDPYSMQQMYGGGGGGGGGGHPYAGLQGMLQQGGAYGCLPYGYGGLPPGYGPILQGNGEEKG